jgi:outer membrane protein assembly factor BamB
MKTLNVLIAVASIGAAAARADSPLAWPQFRGPNGSGVADDQKPPVELGPDKNVKWKVAVPSGLSSPIVAGDSLIVTAFDSGKLYTIAYNRADGQEAWRAEASAPEMEKFHKTEGSPAASTPATDGERIVSYFGSCGLSCYDLSGKELWKLKMPPVAMDGNFGSGVSPIIADGTIVLVRDQTKDAKILAVDLVTGLPKWEKVRKSTISYCTPVIWDNPAGKQVVAAGHARIIGYDLKSGEEKWWASGIPSGCCASPVTADGILYFAGWSPGGADDPENAFPTFDSLLKDLDKDNDQALSRDEAEKAFEGFFDNQDQNKDGSVTRDEWDTILKFMNEGQNSAFALKLGGTGDVTESHALWKQTKGLPYIPSAIVYRGQVVMIKDGGIVTAYDAKTGAEVYQRRAAASGQYYASPVAANGLIYFTSLDGVISVLRAGSDKPNVVAKNASLEERTAATPAIAGDTLYVRTEKHLYAFADSD